VSAVLETRGVTVRFEGLVAVDSVSVRIPERVIHGIIGPNGAGKTTLFNAISGLVTPTSGSVHFGDRDVTGTPTFLRSRLGMRRTFQSVQLIPQFTVLENVLVGLHDEIRENPLRSILSWSGRSTAEEEAQERVVETLGFLGIGETLFKRPIELSFAQQRFVEIARALVARPKLLLLDEPAAGLSPSEIAALNGLLRKLRAESQVTVVLVEHVLSLVFDVSDRITVLDSGQVIAEGTPVEVEADPRVRAAYLGDEHA
jgi:branched-chain amino acid transport system ATP-binding protein